MTTRTTSYSYDADGNQLTSKGPAGNITTTACNADDKAAIVTGQLGNATLACYDGDGNTAEVVPAAGVAASSLTGASCPTAYPSGYSARLAADATLTAYNAASKPTQETTPAPAWQSGYDATTYAYDGACNLTKTIATGGIWRPAPFRGATTFSPQSAAAAKEQSAPQRCSTLAARLSLTHITGTRRYQHATAFTPGPRTKITNKGNYYLLGQIKWSEDLGYAIAHFTNPLYVQVPH